MNQALILTTRLFSERDLDKCFCSKSWWGLGIWWVWTVLPYQDKDNYEHAKKNLENLKVKILSAYEADHVRSWKATSSGFCSLGCFCFKHLNILLGPMHSNWLKTFVCWVGHYCWDVTQWCSEQLCFQQRMVKDHQVLRNIHDLQERDQPDQQYTLLTYSWQTNYSSLMYS